MKSILVLSVSNLGCDPRVHRQLTCLAKSYDVTAAGLAPSSVKGVGFIQMVRENSLLGKIKEAMMLVLRQYQIYYWSRSYVLSTLRGVEGEKFDVIVANDLNTLPLALKIANGKSRVIFDAHEYAPREFEDWLLWRIFFQRYAHSFCKKYLPQVDGMMTVCQGIADEYKRNYGVDCVVVTNAPAYQHLVPNPGDASVIRMIHHGAAIPSRHLERMIEMMQFLGGQFHLDFMLMAAEQDYLNRLKKLASGDRRIRFVDPVAMQDISKVCNRYDIGVFLLPPVNFNYTHALPNKFFEFVQGRLAIAIGPSPEMARLVHQYDCGVVAENFSPQAMAKAIAALSRQQIMHYKQQANKAAAELCAEHNEQQLLDLVEGR